MNCKAIQRHLLGVEDLVRLPEDLQAHLDECPACGAWQRRLLQIERHIPLLPVPPSSALASVQRRLLNPRTTHLAPRSAAPGPRRWRWAAAGLAAGLLLCALGLWALHGPDNPTPPNDPRRAPDPLLANLLQRNLELAKAVDAQQRLEALAWMASDLSGETRSLVSANDLQGLQNLADCYGKVVHQGIVERARGLHPGPDARFLKEIAGRLAGAGADAERLARELPPASEPLREPITSIAAAAREGSRRLRALTGEKAADTERPEQPAARRRTVGANRVLLASAPTAPLLFAAPGDGRPDPAIALEQARRFQRNRSLIETLVNSGIQLAAEVDPLRRAEQCTGVAERLAQEIDQAARNRDGARAAELGQHFRSVLKLGVAANVTSASRIIQRGSTAEQDMRRIGAQVEAISEPLQKQLQLASEDLETRADMQRALQAVFDGRSEVERAIGSRGQPRDRPRDARVRPA